MTILRFSQLSQRLDMEAAAGGEPEPRAAAGHADRRQALAGECAGGGEADPGRRAGTLATEGAVDPGKCPLTEANEGRALCRRQGVSRALAAEGHRTTSSATIASSVGRAQAIRRGASRRVW